MDIIERIERYSRFGSKLGLARMDALLDRLGHPEKELKCIHIAGTNGKGSVSRLIYNGLLACGYDCCLYTSPFLEVFNERMEYNGRFISDDELEKAGSIVLEEAEKLEESPTEFEVITCIAFVYFASLEPDFVILETGLGGRGDSTNVVTPLLSVITSISYDHTDRLGNTIEQIAGEKAGIIKPGIPVVANIDNRDALKVIARTCYSLNSPLNDASKYKPAVHRKDLSGAQVSIVIDGIRYDDIIIQMAGDYQIENLITAVSAIENLRRRQLVSLDKEKLYTGLREAVQPGRFEIMGRKPYIILDGAHNPGGAKALADTVSEYFEKDRVLVVCGILADKDRDGILTQFLRISENYITTEPVSQRKASCEELAEELKSRGVQACSIRDAKAAYQKAMEEQDKYDCILFAGSLYLIGEIRRIIVHGKE